MATTDASLTKIKHVLVTGGVGFIGSHTVIELLQRGCQVTIVDNLCNSKLECLERIQEIAKSTNIKFFQVLMHLPQKYQIANHLLMGTFHFQVDISDRDALEKVFKTSKKFDSCIHFAALKAVGESLKEPLSYYSNNVGGTLILLQLLAKYGCKSIGIYSRRGLPTFKSAASNTVSMHSIFIFCNGVRFIAASSIRRIQHRNGHYEPVRTNQTYDGAGVVFCILVLRWDGTPNRVTACILAAAHVHLIPAAS